VPEPNLPLSPTQMKLSAQTIGCEKQHSSHIRNRLATVGQQVYIYIVYKIYTIQFVPCDRCRCMKFQNSPNLAKPAQEVVMKSLAKLLCEKLYNCLGNGGRKDMLNARQEQVSMGSYAILCSVRKIR
jgi:hypothetical protein